MTRLLHIIELGGKPIDYCASSGVRGSDTPRERLTSGTLKPVSPVPRTPTACGRGDRFDDVTGKGVQFGEFVGGQSHIECADIAEHVLRAACARNRHHVGSARQHPRERNLAWVDTEPRGHPRHGVDHAPAPGESTDVQWDRRHQ